MRYARAHVASFRRARALWQRGEDSEERCREATVSYCAAAAARWYRLRRWGFA